VVKKLKPRVHERRERDLVLHRVLVVKKIETTSSEEKRERPRVTPCSCG
jgi:hypothetical protein